MGVNMYYFKELNDDGTIKSIQSSSNKRAEDDFTSMLISQEEYEKILAEWAMEAEEENKPMEDEITPEEFLQLIEEAF